MVPAALLPLVAGLAAADDFTQVTTYRLWPRNGKASVGGLQNVDSGDAAGDALFGLSNLLLPQLCAVEPDFLWCENRGSLSGGNQWMVYTEYTVKTKVFGEYTPCNPCQSHFNGTGGGGDAPPKCPDGKPDGTFVCEAYGSSGGSSPPPPKQCQGGYDIWHRDCFNGTVFQTIQGDEGDCCAACTAAGDKCAGWNMPHGYNGSTCQLMTYPLVQWDDGQSLSQCKAAQRARGRRDCWYDDPQYNATFDKFCDRSECTCGAITQQAMGREESAMCHEGRRRSRRRLQVTSGDTNLPDLTKEGWHSPPAPPPVPAGFWHCTQVLNDLCPWDQYRHDPAGCSSCATDNSDALKEAGCDQAAISHGCYGNYEKCFAVLDTLCSPAERYNPTSCYSCAHDAKHTHALEAANCTEFFLDYECGRHHHHGSAWEEYIGALACHLNGTWYSTHSAGQCNGNDNDPNCFWKVAKQGRTVNQTCVDNNVVAAVQKVRPECFAKCPQPTNQSSSCYLHCLFDTMVGNATLKVKAMPVADIVQPFVNSFLTSDPTKGGCASV